MSKKFLIPIGIAVMALGVFLIYQTSSSRAADISKVLPKVEVSAVKLLDEFEQDEEQANTLYSGNVILVKGRLIEVKNIDEKYQVVLEAENSIGNVVCNIDDNISSRLGDLKIGDLVEVKGLCTGYMFDVVLDQAIINI